MPLPTASVTDYYYSKEFKTLVRSEKEVIFNNAVEQTNIPPHMLVMYKNRFYGLLRQLGVPQNLWWATAYINDITDPNQDIMELKVLYTINESQLSTNIARSNTKQG